MAGRAIAWTALLRRGYGGQAAQVSPRFVRLAVLALLAFYAGLTICASTQKGLSFDEGEELAVGYNIWENKDFRFEGANGDFVKRWATLPYLISRPKLPPLPPTDLRRQDQPYVMGFKFFYASGNVPAELLFPGRAMAVILGVATGLLTFFCAREVFGSLGGLFALALFTLSPHMLAFGGIVSTEMPTCLALLASTACIWRLLHRVTWAWLAASLGFLAMLVLSKPTALVIFPITGVLLFVKLASGRPLEWRLGRRRTIASRLAQAQIFLVLIVLHGLAAWSALWAHYDFRYVASPGPDAPELPRWEAPAYDPVDPGVQSFLLWSRAHHFLPEGYLDGIKQLLISNESRLSFMNGEWKYGGWRTFFIYAIWAKTSPALFFLMALGMGGWWWARRRGRREARQNPAMSAAASAPSLYSAIPYFTLVAVYFAVAAGQQLNIGHRHVLPIYPALDVLIGGSVGLLWTARAGWTRLVIALLMVWRFVGALVIYPDYLAYFNPLAGGPAHGYEHLVDSSLDWGMDLPGLKRWLTVNNPGNRDHLYFSYFGTGNPQFTGLKFTQLPSYPDWQPGAPYGFAPGIYAISATLLESLYTKTPGPWNPTFETLYRRDLADLLAFAESGTNPAEHARLLNAHPKEYWDAMYDDFVKLRFGRLCAWLRHNRPPDDNVGHSILIWRLDQAALDAAQFGPPAELVEIGLKPI